MKTKFPFKYNKIAAFLMLAPLGMAQAAAPYFLENATPGTDFELLFTVHDSASSSMLLDIDDNNNVHLAFTSDNDSVPRYAKYEDGVVTSQALDASSNAANGYPTVLVNPAIENGLVTIYIQDGVVKVATSTDNGTSWAISANDMPNIINEDIRRIQTSIDSQGKLYVAYTATSGASVVAKMHINAYNTITDAWTDETNTVVGIRDNGKDIFSLTDSSVDIVVAADDKPYAIYRNSAGHYIDIYTPNDEGVWLAYRINGGNVPTRLFRGTYAKIAIDNEGSIYILNATIESNQNLHADVFKVEIDYDNNTAGGSFYAESLLDKLTVTPNSLNGGSDTTLSNTQITSISRPVFDSNNNMFFVFNDPTVTDTKDFIVARIDAETGDVTRLNNNYAAVTGVDTPTAGFNTVDLAIGENDRPVVVFNEGMPTVMRLGLTAGDESLAYLVFNGNDLVVGSLTGIDADGDAITYSITDDSDGSVAALFEVDGATNQLKLKAPIVENHKVYNLTVEASANGESNSVDIEVTVELLPDSDNDGTPDIYDAFPNDPTEQVDTDEDGYGDNIDPDPNDPNDVSAPVISFVNEAVPLVINATGHNYQLSSTELESFIAENLSATDKITPDDDRNGDVDIAIVSDFSAPLASGVHTVQVSATDNVGNVQYFDIDVLVNPAVQVGTNLVVEADGILTVPVNLKGLAPAYPVVLNYTVTPSNTGITSAPLTTSFDEGDVIEIKYDLGSVPLEERAQAGESILVEITDATNVAVSAGTTSSAQVISGNVAPVVTLSVSQLNDTGTYENVNLVAGSVGNAVVEVVEDLETIIREAYVPLVKVTANISDLNASDTHCVTFTSAYGELVEYVDPNDVIDPDAEPLPDCDLSNTFIFDPSNLPDTLGQNANNQYSLSASFPLLVNVVENLSVAPFTVERSIDVDVSNILDTLSTDSNENGIADSAESDTSIYNSTILAIVADQAPLQVSAGLSLSLGKIAFENRFTRGVASIAVDEVELDPHYTPISDIIDFEVNGLQQVGDSVSVVVPLTSDTVIPEAAVYRKYTTLNGWFDFVTDANNQIASALKDNSGNCPAPYSISYTDGLTEGDNCIQLTIEDGGLNDGDGLANGTVVDPSVLAIAGMNTPPVIVSLENHATNSGEEFIVQAIVSDAENDSITYTWTQVELIQAEGEEDRYEALSADSPLFADVVNANAVDGVFVAPIAEAGTELMFSLTVNDGVADSEPKVFSVQIENVNVKPEHEIDRQVGSFGWVMGLFTLGGLVLRSKRKNT